MTDKKTDDEVQADEVQAVPAQPQPVQKYGYVTGRVDTAHGEGGESMWKVDRSFGDPPVNLYETPAAPALPEPVEPDPEALARGAAAAKIEAEVDRRMAIGGTVDTQGDPAANPVDVKRAGVVEGVLADLGADPHHEDEMREDREVFITGDTQAEGEAAEGEAPEEDDGYEAMTVEALKDEIRARNEDRDEEHHLSLSGNKSDLVQRLTEDDAAQK